MFTKKPLSEICEEFGREKPHNINTESGDDQVGFIFDAEYLHSARLFKTVDDLKEKFGDRVKHLDSKFDSVSLAQFGLIIDRQPSRFRKLFKDFSSKHIPVMGEFLLGIRAPGGTFKFNGRTATNYLRCCVWLFGWRGEWNEFTPISNVKDVEFEYILLPVETHNLFLNNEIFIVYSTEMRDEWYWNCYGPQKAPPLLPGYYIKGSH
jgi:hypothetical protein